MRFVILHYHILKNAGSTIEEMLDRSFHGRYHRYETPGRESTISPAELLRFIVDNPHLQALSSHHIRYPLPVAKDMLFFDICFLRDPLDRARSMYDYFRKRPAPGDPISDLANGSAPGDFIRGMVSDHSLHIANVQVNLLAQAGDSDEPDRGDLAVACDRILKASFPGVLDLFDESVAAGEYFLRAAFPGLNCDVPAVNVSGERGSTLQSRIEQLRTACDPDVFRRLVEMNSLDFELLNCARQEVMRRFQLVPRGNAPQAASAPPRVERSAPGLLTRARRLAKGARLFPRRPSLFDPNYYAANNPGAARHPLLHFIQRGAAEGRNPHPLFDIDFYRTKYPESAEKDGNPLVHYLKLGATRPLNPHPLFDAAFYLDRNPDVRRSKMNPLLHYVKHGAAERRKPHPWFDPEFYLAGCDAASQSEAAANPLLHFLRWKAASPHPLFDIDSAGAEPWLKPLNLQRGSITIGDIPLGEGFQIWEDAAGRMHFNAPAAQRRFFQSVNLGQIRTLMNS